MVRICESVDRCPLVKPVALMTGEDVRVKVPDILVAVGLIMLSNRCAGAPVGRANRNGHSLDHRKDRSEILYRDDVEILVMRTRYH
jgi:hypothetical protein